MHGCFFGAHYACYSIKYVCVWSRLSSFVFVDYSFIIYPALILPHVCLCCMFDFCVFSFTYVFYHPSSVKAHLRIKFVLQLLLVGIYFLCDKFGQVWPYSLLFFIGVSVHLPQRIVIFILFFPSSSFNFFMLYYFFVNICFVVHVDFVLHLVVAWPFWDSRREYTRCFFEIFLRVGAVQSYPATPSWPSSTSFFSETRMAGSERGGLFQQCFETFHECRRCSLHFALRRCLCQQTFAHWQSFACGCCQSWCYLPCCPESEIAILWERVALLPSRLAWISFRKAFLAIS